jgi:hypothetical protein
MQKQHLIVIVLSLSMLVGTGILVYTDDTPADPSARKSSPDRAKSQTQPTTSRTRANARTDRSTGAIAAPAVAPTKPAVVEQDPFLVAPSHNPMLPPGEAPPEGAGPAPGQSMEAWLEQEFTLERERQVQDWEAFDAQPEDPAISAPLQAQITADFEDSMPKLSGLRGYEAQCRGGRCMVTVEWDRLVDAQNAMEQLINHSYPQCSRIIYLTPDALGTEDAPYQQLISLKCRAS